MYICTVILSNLMRTRKSKITFFSIFMIQFGRSEQVIYPNKALDSIDSKAKGKGLLSVRFDLDLLRIKLESFTVFHLSINLRSI